jgi:radical SAM superfamily enzyme YgiQ (UPF0313 family)
MRKTSLTFAPEAGSERLRKLLHKNIDMDELFSVASDAFASGYRLLKLYFMIGLPTETKEDLDQIREVCVKLSALKKTRDGHPAQLNVTISNFIPKPHTPFAWQAMATQEELIEKQAYLREIFKKLRGSIHLKFHDTRMSFLEGVLSRGDRRLAGVIAAAFAKGARFDAWDEHFNPDIWLEAFAACSLDPGEFLAARSYESVLPWDFIDVGFEKR